jgi:hypothetical protein
MHFGEMTNLDEIGEIIDRKEDCKLIGYEFFQKHPIWAMKYKEEYICQFRVHQTENRFEISYISGTFDCYPLAKEICLEIIEKIKEKKECRLLIQTGVISITIEEPIQIA